MIKPAKPCPWCGSDAKVIPDNGYGDCLVGCSDEDDDCFVMPCVMLDVGEVDEAIDKWNDRLY